MGFERSWCCCSSKGGATISGTLVMTISIMQLMLHILIYAFYEMDVIVNYLLTALYLGLGIFDCIIILISVIMLHQNDRETAAGGLLAWMVLMGIYMVYEAALNTFNLIVLGAAGLEVDGYGYVVPPITLTSIGSTKNPAEYLLYGTIAYWGIKLMIYIAAMVAVAGRYRDLRDEIGGNSRSADREPDYPKSTQQQQQRREPDYSYRQQQQTPQQNYAYQQNTNNGYGYRY